MKRFPKAVVAHPAGSRPAVDVELQTPVGRVTLERTPQRRSSYIVWGGAELAFPEPYASDADTPVGRYLSGSPGAVVRSLAARARLAWHVAPEITLRIEDDGTRRRLVKTVELDRAVEILAHTLMSQIDPDRLVRVMEAASDALQQPIIWSGSLQPVHVHRKYFGERQAYLGALAPLGGVSLGVLLPELGYHRAQTVLPLPPSRFVSSEPPYPYDIREQRGTAWAWVKPAFRAADALVESLAIEHGVPAARDAPEYQPLLVLAHGGLDGVEADLGYAFARGLWLESAGQPVCTVDLLLPLDERAVAEHLPAGLHAELRAAEHRLGCRLKRIVPRARGEVATLPDEEHALAKTVASDLRDRPTHPLSAERFTIFPSHEEHRAVQSRLGRHDHWDRLPSFVIPDFDEASYVRAVLKHLERDVAIERHPLLIQAPPMVEHLRSSILPVLERLVQEGAERVRQVLDALSHGVNLLEQLRPEDLEPVSLLTPAPRTIPPDHVSAPPVRWWQLAVPEDSANWEGALLVFAVTREGVVPVPGSLVSSLLRQPEAVVLPSDWEWRADVFRFAAVAAARRSAAGPFVLGSSVHVAGFDAQRGRRVATLIAEGEWTSLALAVAERVGVVPGDPGRLAHHLQHTARPAETLPDPEAPAMASELSYDWLAGVLDNPTLHVVIERAPAPDIDREADLVAERAPRFVSRLDQWPRLRPMAANRFALLSGEVESFGRFIHTPLLVLPRTVLGSIDDLLDLDMPGDSVVLLHSWADEHLQPTSGGEARRAVWLRQSDAELHLEHGVVEIASGVVVRLAGEAAAQAEGDPIQVAWGRRGSQVMLIPARLPALSSGTTEDLTELFRRPPPLTRLRGEQIPSMGVTEATLLEAYRGGTTYAATATLLRSWGAHVSAATVSSHVRRIQREHPALYAEVMNSPRDG